MYEDGNSQGSEGRSCIDRTSWSLQLEPPDATRLNGCPWSLNVALTGIGGDYRQVGIEGR